MAARDSKYKTILSLQVSSKGHSYQIHQHGDILVKGTLLMLRLHQNLVQAAICPRIYQGRDVTFVTNTLRLQKT